MSEKVWRPTRAQLAAAVNKVVPDLIGPDLKVLFCGINPGLYTAAIGHHFGRPGNRFWPALHLGGFTDKVMSPFDEAELLDMGWGITNVVARATARADELTDDELRAGAKDVERKVRRYKPAWLAVVGLGTYRVAWQKRDAKAGEQPDVIGDTRIWVLPNPSGVNAHHTLAGFGQLFGELRKRLESPTES